MVTGPLGYGMETAQLEVKGMSPRIWGSRGRGWELLSPMLPGSNAELGNSWRWLIRKEE